MIGWINCAIAALIIGCTLCGASPFQSGAIAAPRVTLSPSEDTLTGIDALAARIVEKINADNVTVFLVVGGGSREGKVTELGVQLRDALNDSLVRQAAGVHVLTGTEMRNGLKQLRISEGMLYSNALADWLAQRNHADGLATIEVERVENGHAEVLVQFADRRAKPTKKANDKKKKIEFSSEDFQGQINLTAIQVKSATVEYRPPLHTPAMKSGTDGVGMPWCDYCPKPEYSEVARLKRIQGTVYLLVTVLPDGSADDILISRPLGFGLDATTIDQLLKWKFKPAVDGQKLPVATQVPIEIAFQLYK
jgi:TonB family protein